ncbi:hypothetical protein [Mycolicibacterium arenosum]|uniref:DUF732 domain-containing protein n=1 Tax=Mycolicibacterium arenosum TaxID=2952157 RepID=A0ABT1MBD9_9MYCO|nr:hypothetical protein [Mycolicibacterium sp. CAU 1645]MCP9276463.1 hypothetical protein [Mycolicibacterium sp. CAU 1645]
MPTSALTYSVRRVFASCLALLAVLASFELLSRGSDPDPFSFHEGYSAIADRGSVRAAMAHAGATPTRLCNNLFDDALARGTADRIVHHDFLNGCERAVGDAME